MQQIIPEVGTERNKLSTKKHFANLADMTPSNNKSNGKKSDLILGVIGFRFLSDIGVIEQGIAAETLR